MEHELTHLDLFSGIGGFALAAQRAGFRTIGFSEVEPYACKVLAERFPGVPNLGDVRHMPAFAGLRPTVLTGGYPCQPFSFAGKRQGAGDDRHLWPAMRRVIKVARPTWIIAENVFGHVSMGLDVVLAELEADGYATQPFVVPACGVDAPHKRERLWIVAYSEHARRDAIRLLGQGKIAGPVECGQASPVSRPSEDVANADCHGGRKESGELCDKARSAEIGARRRPRAQPCDSGEILADANTERESQPAGLEREIRGRTGDGGESELLENASGGRRGRKSKGKDEQQRRTEVIGAGEDVSDAALQHGAEHGQGAHEPQRIRETFPDANVAGCEKRHVSAVADGSGSSAGPPDALWREWLPEPTVGRVANGVPYRSHRLKGLGNAIVPQVVEPFFHWIAQIERGELT